MKRFVAKPRRIAWVFILLCQLVNPVYEVSVKRIVEASIDKPFVAYHPSVVAERDFISEPHFNRRMVLPSIVRIGQCKVYLFAFNALLSKPLIIQYRGRLGEVSERKKGLHWLIQFL